MFHGWLPEVLSNCQHGPLDPRMAGEQRGVSSVNHLLTHISRHKQPILWATTCLDWLWLLGGRLGIQMWLCGAWNSGTLAHKTMWSWSDLKQSPSGQSRIHFSLLAFLYSRLLCSVQTRKGCSAPSSQCLHSSEAILISFFLLVIISMTGTHMDGAYGRSQSWERRKGLTPLRLRHPPPL